MNRRQFLIQSAKAALAVAAGVLGGAALAKKPTYEVRSGDDLWIGNPDLYEESIDRGFIVEGWMRADGKMVQWDEINRVSISLVDTETEWTHVEPTVHNTYIIPTIDWGGA